MTTRRKNTHIILDYMRLLRTAREERALTSCISERKVVDVKL
jgi:hypothetical protein